MVARVMTGMVQGVEGLLIKVETDLSQGLPMMNLFGSLSAEVREGKERVRTALKNTGIRLPPDRITINFSPGDIRKNGTSFDLAIAVSLLIVLGLVPEDYAEDILFLGELSLNGDLMPVHGVLPVVKTAYDLGYRRCLVPVDNVEEALLWKTHPEFYNDPVCSYGYCRGTETINYVRQVENAYRVFREYEAKRKKKK